MPNAHAILPDWRRQPIAPSALPGTGLSTVGFDSGGKATRGCLAVRYSWALCELSEVGLNVGLESTGFPVPLVEEPQRLAHASLAV